MHKEKGSEVQPLNASNEVGGITSKPNSVYKVKDLIHNSQEIDKEILGMDDDTLFRRVYHGSGAEFDATQKEAVEKRGIVMPGLRNVEVNVVDVPRHDFTGNLKEARSKAREWAVENYTGKEFDLPENAGKYIISKNAIGKYLDKSAFDKSDNAAVHLSALKMLPEIISNSIEVEIHADYSKGENGARSVENGVYRNDLLVHRIYGAINIDGKTYRVKTTIHEFRDSNTANTPHSYEVTEIELIEDSTVTPNDGIDNPLNRSVSSISATKLLDGVEKSYDNGKKVLDESVDLTKDTVSDLKYGAIEHNVMFRRSSLVKGLRELEDGEVCDVERVFVENKYFEFSGVNKIKSYSDVAYIFKQLEDESVENAFAVLVKRGKPTVLHLGMGHYTQTMVNKSVLNVAVNRMKPDKIYFVHNHPSGVLKASMEDVRMLQSLKEAYGSKMEDGIIINTRSGEYGIFNEDSYTTKVDTQKGLSDTSEAKPLKVYSFSKQVFSKDYRPGRSFSSSEDVASFISSHRLGDRKKLGLLISNNSGVTGNVFLPYTDINKENARAIANDIIYYTSVMGGTHAVLFGNAPLRDVGNNGIGTLVGEFSGLRLLDYLKIDGGRYESAMDEGIRFRYTAEEQGIIDKAKADGTWMKAPNGKPTNLNEKQWVQVRTKAFKKWFGDWELANLYNRALTAWNDKNSKGKVVMGLSERAKNRFGELLGTNVKQLVITDDAIRHIKKKHGEHEELRGQKNMTPEDVVVIPYLINNFDSMELNPKENDNKGNRAIEIKKRINGVSVIATIERGENKEFLVTSYQYVRSDALDVSNETPGLNVRNDSDIANVQKEIEEIKSSALNSSKVVDENGEPLVVYHSGASDIKEFSHEYDKTGIGRQFWGGGFYFGTVRSKDEWARRYEEKTGKQAKIYPIFLE